MSAEEINSQGPDGPFMGYLATPESGASPAPGVVVIQEIFGVNQVMRDTANWLAGEGYLALVPDLFWRIEPGIQITDKTDEEMQHKSSASSDGGYAVRTGSVFFY